MPQSRSERGTWQRLAVSFALALPACTSRSGADERVPSAKPETSASSSDAPAAALASPPDSPDPPVVSSDLSLHDRLYAELADGPESAIALFADYGGVIAVSDSGKRTRIVSEPFSTIVVDYQSGLLWLGRSWSREHEAGLFVGDLFAGALALRKVSASTASWQLTNAAGETYPIDVGACTTTVARDAVSTTSDLGTCADERSLAPEIVEIVTAAVRRGYLIVPSPRLELIGTDHYRVVATPQEHCDECGRVIDLPGTDLQAISVETFGDYRHVLWNLYDPATREFISAKSFARSLEPWNNDLITHLMICHEHTAMVVGGDLRTPTGELIYSSHRSVDGACLHGGTVFVGVDLDTQDPPEFDDSDNPDESTNSVG